MGKRAHVIVVGNEKGGTGKSTIAMHLVVALLDRGLSVGSLDLDGRQASLTRYVENRAARPDALPLPDHVTLPPESDAAALDGAFADLAARHDVVVVDTPGSDHPLSRLGHAFADTLVTPLNDSLVDLDLLARIEPGTLRILRPGPYAEMVWDTRKARALRGERAALDWIVLRNRLSSLDARNKRDMHHLLDALARRLGFRLCPGLGERVVYRALFLDGLTLLDLRRPGVEGGALSLGTVAARQELRALVETIGAAALTGRPG